MFASVLVLKRTVTVEELILKKRRIQPRHHFNETPAVHITIFVEQYLLLGAVIYYCRCYCVIDYHYFDNVVFDQFLLIIHDSIISNDQRFVFFQILTSVRSVQMTVTVLRHALTLNIRTRAPVIPDIQGMAPTVKTLMSAL